MTKWIYDDGGRSAAGISGKRAGDCVTRAIAIAAKIPYIEAQALTREVMGFDENEDNAAIRAFRGGDEGVHKEGCREVFARLGWKWTATMKIGQGCKVHLRAEELPSGRIVANVSKHLVAVIDGIIHDTYDCSRNGTRCVYGYWSKP